MKIRSWLLICICFLLPANKSFCQWVQTNGPGGATVYGIAVSGTTIFVCADGGGIFLSTNNGESWAASNTGLPVNTSVWDLAAGGGKVFASTSSGLLVTVDCGKSWTKIKGAICDRFSVNGDTVLVGFGGGFFLSRDNGDSWDTIPLQSEDISGGAACGGNILAGFYSSPSLILLSTDNGTTWTDTTFRGSGRGGITDFTVNRGIIFAATDSGVIRSTDKGVSWTAANTGLPGTRVGAFLTGGDTLFVGLAAGVFFSTDNGDSWTASSPGRTEKLSFYGFARSGGAFFAAGSGGVFRSVDNGTTWTAVNAGIADASIEDLISIGGAIIASRHGIGGFCRSTDGGASWTDVVTDDSAKNHISCFAMSGTTLFAGTSFGDTNHNVFGNGVLRSTDYGASWTRVAEGLPTNEITALACRGDTVFAGTHGAGVFRSTDNGASWSAMNDGLWKGVASNQGFICALAVGGGSVFAGDFFNGLYVSSNSGESWIAGGKRSDLSLTAGGNGIFVTSWGGYFFSGDNGASWRHDTNHTFTASVFDAVGRYIFAADFFGGVYLSANDGKSWIPVNEGFTNTGIHSLAVKGDTLLAGTYSCGVWRRPISEMAALVSTKRRRETSMQAHFNIVHPGRSGAKIAFDIALPLSGRVSVTTYDLSGRKIASFVDRFLEAGSYRYVRDTRRLARGSYAVRFQAGAAACVKTVRIVR